MRLKYKVNPKFIDGKMNSRGAALFNHRKSLRSSCNFGVYSDIYFHYHHYSHLGFRVYWELN